MALGVLFALTLPGLVGLLVLLVALERFGLWARGRSLLSWRRDRDPAGAQSLPLFGAGLEEVDAFFTGAKRAEVDERQARSLLRDEEAEGRLVDLDAGVVRISRPGGPAGPPRP